MKGAVIPGSDQSSARVVSWTSADGHEDHFTMHQEESQA